ncbi:phosphate ABC transporter permease PstA [Salinibaculum rarum]|uniref:phosphate ABC transporter permease PstA n=1 Tax=Salinibaculum rarum TaxID=3058903 RepID=UPI00265E3033|nr:phosphate ABC transporter permease PstA [Salinibaculum sp. KK48]
MATESEPSELSADRSLRWRRFKGRLFVGVLLLATAFGILSLLALFVFIGLDAFGPRAAEPQWYLIYFGTLVGPLSAYTLYTRRDEATKAINARAFAVTFGSLILSLVVYVVPLALSPYDFAYVLAFVVLPPLAVRGYASVYGENHLTGPGIPVSAILGFAVAWVTADIVVPTIEVAAAWIMYVGIVTVPVAATLGVYARRRDGNRKALLAAGGTFLLAFGAVGAGLAQGTDPSLWVVLASGIVAPVGYVYGETIANRTEGRLGLLGPFVLGGGVVVGALVERQLGVSGLESWLTPTLLLESWSTFRPENAGIYPQLVGSIIIVGLMALLAFPVGIGAAIYLEEYAPDTGWRGRLATVLDVNISNLAGVPSVVYGLLGLALFRNVFGLATNIVLAASMTLGLLILPIVIVSTQEALRSVPDELRRGSYGLGASRWQTVRNVVLPEAVPGILTGTILALGRAIGETAPLVMIGVAATRFTAPADILGSATALPLQLFAAAANAKPAYREGVVAAAAIVLLVTMLLMNATAILIRNKYQND